MRTGKTILAAALLGLLAGCGQGGPRVEVRVNGQPLPAAGVEKYGAVYVPVGPLAEALGVRMVYNPDKPQNGATLQDLAKGRFVHLHTGANDCHVGGETVRLKGPSLYLDRGTRQPMAPVGLVSEAFGATVRRTADTVDVTLAP